MRSLRERLKELGGGRAPAPVGEREIRGLEKSGFVWRENRWGRYLYRQETVPLAEKRGRYALEELRRECFRRFSFLALEGEQEAEIERCLFFDTETTGLGVGTGVTVFLYGVGYVAGQTFVTEQLFLPDPSGEAALLHDLLALLEKGATLVTYNGKSFDWHLLSNRLLLHRLPVPDHLRHADLLIPSRRLWRGRLPSCRLAEVESSCLRIIRQEDVPGYLIPQLYFDFLRFREMGVLEGVFCHHRQDVVTLAVLLVRLLKWINGTEQREEADELALGKWWMEKGRADEAIPRLMRAAEGEGSPAAVRKEAYRLLSAHWKRTGNFGEAIRCWEKWSDWDRWNPEPLVELAKHYEHREKDFERALAFTNRAIDGLLCKKMMHRFAFTEPDLEALRYRARRLLEKKRGKESCKEPGLFDWKD